MFVEWLLDESGVFVEHPQGAADALAEARHEQDGQLRATRNNPARP
jgi:hypothetical protein